MHSTFAPPRTARHARAVAALEARSPCAACPVCVSASSRSRSTVRESGSGPRCHGSDGVLPSGRDRREAGGGAAAAADAPAAQSCRAGERWHTARRRRRRPPRWLSLLGRRRFASRRRQLLRRESEATHSPPLCGSSKERTRWQSCWLFQAKERVSRKRKHAKNVGERCSGDWRRAGVREREPRISAGDLAVLVCGAAGRGGEEGGAGIARVCGSDQCGR